MNSRPVRSSGCAASNDWRPSRVVGLTLASRRVSLSCPSDCAASDPWPRWVAALAKLIRASRVELLIHEVPPGQPATFGGQKRSWPRGAVATGAAVYVL